MIVNFYELHEFCYAVNSKLFASGSYCIATKVIHKYERKWTAIHFATLGQVVLERGVNTVFLKNREISEKLALKVIIHSHLSKNDLFILRWKTSAEMKLEMAAAFNDNSCRETEAGERADTTETQGLKGLQVYIFCCQLYFPVISLSLFL